jgi:hypothetical protein
MLRVVQRNVGVFAQDSACPVTRARAMRMDDERKKTQTYCARPAVRTAARWTDALLYSMTIACSYKSTYRLYLLSSLR